MDRDPDLRGCGPTPTVWEWVSPSSWACAAQVTIVRGDVRVQNTKGATAVAWPSVSMVVTNYNGLQHLSACFDTLERLEYPRDRLEVVMVDDGSTDGSAAYVRENHPWVRVIENEVNLGFAAANNVGLEATGGGYVVTLNNDTRVESGWLRELVRAAESDPKVGMCASKMLFLNRPRMINSTGICLDRAGIAWDRRGGEPDLDKSDRPIRVFGPCAGAALYRRSMLEEVGGFDEDLFMYLEDVDLAWRAQAAAWRCLYVPRARVYHAHSASSGEGSRFKSLLLGRNKAWVIIKNYPNPYLLLYLPVVLFFDISAIAYALLCRRDIASLRGRVAALRRLRHFLGKRQAVQSRRAISRREMLCIMDPVQNPFRVSLRYRHLAGLAKAGAESDSASVMSGSDASGSR